VGGNQEVVALGVLVLTEEGGERKAEAAEEARPSLGGVAVVVAPC
jgi:hypothetical protein